MSEIIQFPGSKPEAPTPAPVTPAQRRSHYRSCALLWLLSMVLFVLGSVVHPSVGFVLCMYCLVMSLYALFKGVPLPEGKS